MRSSVKVGPEFFANTKRDYSDWAFALVRELVQNGADAGSTRIAFRVTELEGGLLVVCENNGVSMSRDVLVDKLLCLGGTTKVGGGSVGGFGVAKLLLYFMHRSYTIESGDLRVVGSGADYEITEDGSFSGTRSSIVVEGVSFDAFCEKVRVFASWAQLDLSLSLNGEVLETRTPKGYFRKEFSFGRVYSTKLFRNRVVARMRGVPMFSYYSNFERGLFIELAGSSLGILTSNRDGLTSEHRSVFSQFLNELSVDSKSALRPTVATVERYAGKKLVATQEKEIVTKEAIEKTFGVAVKALGEFADNRTIIPLRPTEIDGAAEQVVLDMEFFIRNESNLTIPAYYRPSVDFSPYSMRLVQMWVKALIGLHLVAGRSAVFSVGFVFSDEAEALYSNGSQGEVFYLNPAKIVSQSRSGSRSFQKRFKLTERDRILALAVHEFCHAFEPHHNEAYACKITEVMALALKNRARLV